MAKLTKRQAGDLLKSLHVTADEISGYTNKPIEIEYSYREPDRVSICYKGGYRIKTLDSLKAAEAWLDGMKYGVSNL